MTETTLAGPAQERPVGPHAAFRAARDLLLSLRTDQDAAPARSLGRTCPRSTGSATGSTMWRRDPGAAWGPVLVMLDNQVELWETVLGCVRSARR